MDEYRTCPNCGQRIKAGGKFCPKCGGRCDSTGPRPTPGGGLVFEKKPEPKSIIAGPSPLSPVSPLTPLTDGPTSSVHELCGSGLFLTMAIAISVSVTVGMLQLVDATLPLKMFGILPALFICIGCWICFAGGRKGRMTVTGLNFISVILKIELILWYILIGALVIFGLALMMEDEALVELGFVVLILTPGLPVLEALFLSQLRKPLKEAKKVIQGWNGDLRPNMYCILVLICTGLKDTISLLYTLGSRSIVSALLSSIERAIYENYGWGARIVLNEIFDMLWETFGPQVTWLDMLGDMAQVTTVVCALVILFRLRNRQKWVP